MKEELVGFEVAKLAKEKGFDEKTKHYYMNKGVEDKSMNSLENWNNWFDDEKIKYYSRPTQSLLQKWLREVYNIDVDTTRDSEIHYKDEIRWIVRISDWNDIRVFKTPIAHLNHPNHWHEIDFKSYEEALEKGLQEALKLIK